MSAKAIKYAEENLGVHVIYEQALEARTRLDEVLTELSTARDNRRDLEQRILMREMDIASDERGKHPDMSATGMEKHLKIAYVNDDSLRELKEQLAKQVGDIEGLDYDKEILEHDIRIACARMNELGGYLHYLAEVKAAAKKPATEGSTDAGTVA